MLAGPTKNSDEKSQIDDEKSKITAKKNKDDVKPKLIVNLNALYSSRKVVSDETNHVVITASTEKITPSTPRKKDPNIALFVNDQKKTVGMKKYQFDDDKIKTWNTYRNAEFKV